MHPTSTLSVKMKLTGLTSIGLLFLTLVTFRLRSRTAGEEHRAFELPFLLYSLTATYNMDSSFGTDQVPACVGPETEQ